MKNNFTILNFIFTPSMLFYFVCILIIFFCFFNFNTILNFPFYFVCIITILKPLNAKCSFEIRWLSNIHLINYTTLAILIFLTILIFFIYIDRYRYFDMLNNCNINTTGFEIEKKNEFSLRRLKHSGFKFLPS